MINNWYVRLKQPKLSFIRWLLTHMYVQITVPGKCVSQYQTLVVGDVTKIYIPVKGLRFTKALTSARTHVASKFMDIAANTIEIRLVVVELCDSAEYIF